MVANVPGLRKGGHLTRTLLSPKTKIINIYKTIKLPQNARFFLAHVRHRAIAICCQGCFTFLYCLNVSRYYSYFVSNCAIFLCDGKASSLAGFGFGAARATCQCACLYVGLAVTCFLFAVKSFYLAVRCFYVAVTFLQMAVKIFQLAVTFLQVAVTFFLSAVKSFYFAVKYF
jgi:hypothetical protein